jgi:hypothetical protein
MNGKICYEIEISKVHYSFLMLYGKSIVCIVKKAKTKNCKNE